MGALASIVSNRGRKCHSPQCRRALWIDDGLKLARQEAVHESRFASRIEPVVLHVELAVLAEGHREDIVVAAADGIVEVIGFGLTARRDASECERRRTVGKPERSVRWAQIVRERVG